MSVKRESTVLKAIEAKSQFQKKFCLISDPKVTIPFLWPRGTYGLPKPKSGCPKEKKGSGFVWHEGSRYHDTPTFCPLNEWSNPYDLAGFHGRENVRPYFCIKTPTRIVQIQSSLAQRKILHFKERKVSLR